MFAVYLSNTLMVAKIGGSCLTSSNWVLGDLSNGSLYQRPPWKVLRSFRSQVLKAFGAWVAALGVLAPDSTPDPTRTPTNPRSQLSSAQASVALLQIRAVLPQKHHLQCDAEAVPRVEAETGESRTFLEVPVYYLYVTTEQLKALGSQPR